MEVRAVLFEGVEVFGMRTRCVVVGFEVICRVLDAETTFMMLCWPVVELLADVLVMRRLRLVFPVRFTVIPATGTTLLLVVDTWGKVFIVAFVVVREPPPEVDDVDTKRMYCTWK